MKDVALRDRVALQLETMALPGGPLHENGVNSTLNFLGSADQTALERRVGRAFRDLRDDVHTDNRAAVTAGPPASGKSRVAWELELDKFARKHDPDDFKELLLKFVAPTLLERVSRQVPSELDDGRPVMPLDLAPLVHLHSSRLMQIALNASLRLNEDVLIDVTMKGESTGIEYLGLLETAGYHDVTIYSLDKDVDKAVLGACERWWGGRVGDSDLGGRFVPERIIRAMYDGSKPNSVANARRAQEVGKGWGMEVHLAEFDKHGRRTDRN